MCDFGEGYDLPTVLADGRVTMKNGRTCITNMLKTMVKNLVAGSKHFHVKVKCKVTKITKCIAGK